MGKSSVVLICLALAAAACAEESVPPRPEARPRARPPASPADGWEEFTHPGQPWSWRHPRGWRVQTFDRTVGLATHEGAVVSNVRHRFDYPELGAGERTSAWDFRRVPSHAVVVELSQVIRLVHVCRKTTETPLSLADSEVVRGAYGSPPRLWQTLCLRGQSNFGLNVWLGADSTPEDRAAARKVVRSIRFREPVTTVSCENEAATDVSQEPDYSADYLQRWQTADGCDVRLDVAMTRTGGCYGDETADLLLGWPLGSSSEDDARIYVRDPRNRFGDAATSAAFREDTALPPDARDTWLRQHGSTQLWMVPGDDAFVYLVYPDDTERWPLDESPPGCD
ncbi:MAG TPA: hypothetical protein VG318_08380 [Actinomycetota bacterium]|nr:hypothetical protein [Actinomycetota bacterium]